MLRRFHAAVRSLRVRVPSATRRAIVATTPESATSAEFSEWCVATLRGVRAVSNTPAARAPQGECVLQAGRKPAHGVEGRDARRVGNVGAHGHRVERAEAAELGELRLKSAALLRRGSVAVPPQK
jgi:hypothetical protein